MKTAIACLLWLAAASAAAQPAPTPSAPSPSTPTPSAPTPSASTVPPFTGKAPTITIANPRAIRLTPAQVSRLTGRGNVCYAMRAYSYAPDKDLVARPVQTSMTTCQPATSFAEKRAELPPAR